MELIHLLSTSTIWLLVTVGLISLMIGSFLNVVISRLPIMLEREWKHECMECFGGSEADTTDTSTFNLVVPRSQCPDCGHKISAWENVPVISYLVIGGKCKGCKTHISLQYPLVEITTAVLSILVAYKFGFSKETAALLFFTWMLVPLFMIDAKTMLLPDNLVFPLMWVGILLNMYDYFIPLEQSIIGAVVGYMSLWIIVHFYYLLTGKFGMGHGDFKLLAALGAWGGWQILPFVIFTASALGAVFGILWMLIRRQKESVPMPFGPWLAIPGFIAMVWHKDIVTYTERLFIP